MSGVFQCRSSGYLLHTSVHATVPPENGGSITTGNTVSGSVNIPGSGTSTNSPDGDNDAATFASRDPSPGPRIAFAATAGEVAPCESHIRGAPPWNTTRPPASLASRSPLS